MPLGWVLGAGRMVCEMRKRNRTPRCATHTVLSAERLRHGMHVTHFATDFQPWPGRREGVRRLRIEDLPHLPFDEVEQRLALRIGN